MSSSWPDPTGDEYRRYTGDARPQEGAPPVGPSPYGQQAPYGQQPQVPYGAPPTGAQPGSPYPTYGAQPPYGAMPPYGAPPPYGVHPGPYGMSAYGYGPTGPRMSGGQRAATIVLLVLSALLTFGACGAGLPSLILSIVALSKDGKGGSSSARLMGIGWVVFAVLAIAVTVMYVVLFMHGRSSSDLPAQI